MAQGAYRTTVKPPSVCLLKQLTDLLILLWYPGINITYLAIGMYHVYGSNTWYRPIVSLQYFPALRVYNCMSKLG